MSYFRVMPNALQAQREELEAAYQSLCQDMAEVSRVIQRLGTMTSFDEPIAVLRQTQRNGSDQQVKLRQIAGVLSSVADLYIHAELKNLDGEQPLAFTASGSTPAVRNSDFFRECREMVPGAERLFGMKVVIPEND